MKIVETIKEYLIKYVKENLLSVDFVGADKQYYSGGRCHSRVLGLLVQSFQALGYITDIERRISFKDTYKLSDKARGQNSFRPDITICDKNDKIVGIVEYETIDATKEHLEKKVEYFTRSIPAHETLEFIVFFPTLTTLDRKPNKWIEMQRSDLVLPIREKLIGLSKSYPKITIFYLILDENGFSSKEIMDGIIINEAHENIWISNNN
jgi:hypothetical protein